ncbi:MAG: hypothetical protein LRY63_09025 [Nitrincola sp.]|nr:hypothetical protein [Nitrincola sp.]
MDKACRTAKIMSATPFQEVCLDMLAIEYHEIRKLDGYIDFLITKDSIIIKKVTFFKNSTEFLISEKFTLHVKLLVQGFIHYHEIVYTKADISSALFIVNDGYPSIAWF